MNKKVINSFGLVLLLIPLFPSSPSNAETVSEKLTSESAITSLADDPLETLNEKSASQVATTDEKESSESSSAPKVSPDELNEESVQATRQLRAPYSVTLIEGVDIDADFARGLRTTASSQDLGTSWSGFGKSQDQLTSIDMEALSWINVTSRNLTSLKGIEYATNITKLLCNSNKLETIDLTDNIALTELQCGSNKLENLDLSVNTALVTLDCGFNQLSTLDLTTNVELVTLKCAENRLASINLVTNTELKTLVLSRNQLTTLDLTTNVYLEDLQCYNNQLTSLDLSTNIGLRELQCSYNQLTTLDLAANTKLSTLRCTNNDLSNLDVSVNEKLTTLDCTYSNVRNLVFGNNVLLTYLDCRSNQLTSLDLSTLSVLESLFCHSNKLAELDVTQNPALKFLYCYDNQLNDLDVTQNLALTHLHCASNQLSELNVTANSLLKELNCGHNQLSDLDVSSNSSLTELACESNRIADMSSGFNLNNLTTMNAFNQKLEIPVPSVSSNGETTVDILRTAPGINLSVNSTDISPQPVFSYDGDNILLSNVTRESISDKYINFEASSGNKYFSGSITFFSISELENKLEPSEQTIQNGDQVEWTWQIDCPTNKKAEDIFATLNLPSGMNLDPSSIKKNGSPTTINDIDGTTNLGELNQGESIIFTFKTTVSGNIGEWKEVGGRLDWSDDTVSSPHSNEAKGSVLIQDEEQTYTPKDSDNMAIQSVPVRFNYGVNAMMPTAQTHYLSTVNYLSNTKVVTDGFYTRIKDDRSISTGWKLTVKLSDFKDDTNQSMPNGDGAVLKMGNMSIEKITDRDTSQETIVPSPTGTDVPSNILTSTTLVAGQLTATTLISAQPNEGTNTWQLRIPFNQISLSLPANAGKSGTSYKANLTWSLDDTI